MTLLMRVERYLRLAEMTPSRFGREAAGDPRLVFDLRRGREPRPDMAARLAAFIAAGSAGVEKASPDRKKTVNAGSVLLLRQEAA